MWLFYIIDYEVYETRYSGKGVVCVCVWQLWEIQVSDSGVVVVVVVHGILVVIVYSGNVPLYHYTTSHYAWLPLWMTTTKIPYSTFHYTVTIHYTTIILFNIYHKSYINGSGLSTLFMWYSVMYSIVMWSIETRTHNIHQVKYNWTPHLWVFLRVSLLSMSEADHTFLILHSNEDSKLPRKRHRSYNKPANHHYWIWCPMVLTCPILEQNECDRFPNVTHGECNFWT